MCTNECDVTFERYCTLAEKQTNAIEIHILQVQKKFMCFIFHSYVIFKACEQNSSSCMTTKIT